MYKKNGCGDGEVSLRQLYALCLALREETAALRSNVRALSEKSERFFQRKLKE